MRKHAWCAALVMCGCTTCDSLAPGMPVPREFPFSDLKPPVSATGFHHHSSGLQGVMTQVRFEVPRSALAELEAGLPCTLGPPVDGPPTLGRVGTNRMRWWQPEAARRHRECRVSQGIHGEKVVVDLGQPEAAIVYLLVTDD